MSLDNLPVEWMNVKISDITVKGEQRKPNDSEEFIYVDIGSINRDLKKIENPQFLLGKDAPSRARKVIKKGDVLVSLTRPNLNAVALVGENYDQQIASTGFEVISPMIVESKYLFSLVRTQHFINEISKQEQGALYPAAKSSDVQAYEFPLPPLAEQQEIVRQLDVMLAQVEQIKARLDVIPAILKKFRQSVLADAVSGKLTEAWRKSRNIEFPEEKRYLYEIASIDIGYAFKSKEFTDSGIKLLRGQNIDPLSLKWEDTKYFPESKLDSFKHLFLKEKDIVLAMDRPIVKSGLKLARVSENDLPCVLVQRVARFKDIKVNQDFLWYALLDLNFSNYLVPNQTGSDIPHISGKQILNYELFAPDIREQNQIVIQVSKLFNYIETIEIVVQSAQKRVNLLTQSILAKAFSGELTAEWREQHQDLITGINSAESLLSKIQAERGVSKPAKKTRKKKEV